jgi:cytochrome bd ubiquinol oxidase subunit II
MSLVTFWFVVLVVFWTGFLVLEGFDVVVGMLSGVVAATRTAAARSSGPSGRCGTATRSG